MTGSAGEPPRSSRAARPPRVWRYLLGKVLPRGDREFVLGDLDEEYAGFSDVRAARRWYRSQAIRSVMAVLRYLASRNRAGGRPGRRRADGGLNDMLGEIRYGLRSLRKASALAALVIATLGLGTGATIAIFTVANEVLFEALTFEEPAELVMLWESNRERGWNQVHAAPANVMDWRARVGAFEDVGYFFDDTDGMALRTETGAENVVASRVSGNLFSVLGVRPALGRLFRMEETYAGSEPVVVLSDRAWRRYFGANRDVIGSVVELDRTPYTVIGVMPEWFDYAFTDGEVWVTHGWSRSRVESDWFRQAHVVRAVARLRDGATLEQARAELSSVAAQLREEHPRLNASMEAGLTPLHGFLVREERTPLLLLLGAVGLLLLIAISNVANLLLVRSAARSREVAVRSSLGASRGRVIRERMVESAILATAGTAIGFGCSWGVLAAVRSIGVEGLPPLDLAVDLRLAGFVAGLAVLSALLFGLAPAIRGSRVDLRAMLADAGRTGTAGNRATGISNLIVTAQVALAVMLASVAALTFRSLGGLNAIEDGVDAENVLTFEVNPPDGAYDDAGRVLLAIELGERLRALPGVIDAGVVRRLPLTGYAWTSDFTIRGWSPDRFGTEVRHREALPGYFRTMRIPVLEGELFPDLPSPGRQVPVVVNRAFADRYFPNESPVGRFITNTREPSDGSYWYEIVGVVDNERMSLYEEPLPEIIAHMAGDVPSTLRFVVRTGTDPHSAVAPVRAVLHEVDPGIPLVDVRSMDGIRHSVLSRERFVFTVFGVLASCALLLACVGVYGVAAHSTRTRRREVGIRVALGATRLRILRHFVGSGLGRVGVGLVLGLAGVLAAGRVIESLLWGVEPSDGVTLSAVLAILGLTGLTASYLPARQASRQDAAAVLRDE